MDSDSDSPNVNIPSRRPGQDARPSDDFYIRDLVDDTPGRYPSISVKQPSIRYQSSDNASRRSPSTNITIPESTSPRPRARPRAPIGDIGSQRLVIGIDFGTTYTGVAYATPQSNIATLTGDHGVKVVNTWSSKMSNQNKIPTVISYTPAPRDYEQWGTDLSDNAVAIVNTKLELSIQPTILDELELTLQALESTGFLSFEKMRQPRSDPGYTWKTPEQIITDYLGKILKNLLGDLREFNQVNRGLLSTDIVITVPARWPYEAQNSTFRAVQRAGFNKATFPKLNKILLTTEPEAASVYTAQYLKQNRKMQFLKRDECFVLCDAGGGTVDVIAFQVKQLEPHLILKQITEPSSGRCGATFINTSFKKWLRGIIGRENYQIMDPESADHRISSRTVEGGDLRRLMREFETRKKLFSNGSPEMKIDLRGALEGLDIPPKLNEGELIITSDDMRGFFEPYVDNVIELIKDQCTQVEMEMHREVQNVFLVGGFGESPYLQEELKKSLEERDIVLRRPDKEKSWTAVVQGAVIYGIEKARHQNLKSGSPSPRSYGIVVDEAFTPHKYNPRDLRKDEISNEAIAHKQFAWLVRKGDLILSSEKTVVQKEFTYRFQANDNRKHRLSIYEFPDEDDKVPERWATGQSVVAERGVVTSDLSTIPINSFERRRNDKNGQTYYTAYLVCRMQLTADVLEVEVLANEQRVGRTEILMSSTKQETDSDSD